MYDTCILRFFASAQDRISTQLSAQEFAYVLAGHLPQLGAASNGASPSGPIQEVADASQLRSTPSTDALATELSWNNGPHATYALGLQDPYQASQTLALEPSSATDALSYAQTPPMSEGFSPLISNEPSFEPEEDGMWDHTALAQTCAGFSMPPLELDSDFESFKALFPEVLLASSDNVADLEVSGLPRQGEPVARTSEFGESIGMQ